MKLFLGFLPTPQSQILIHPPHASKNCSTKFHTTFNGPCLILPNQPFSSVCDECFRCSGGWIGESYSIESESEFSIEGVFEFVYVSEVDDEIGGE